MSNSQTNKKTPERIDKNGIDSLGTNHFMLEFMMRSDDVVFIDPKADLAVDPKTSQAIDQAVDQAIGWHGYALEHADHPNHVGQWAHDEAAAYRDNGGFQEGRDAVQVVRRAKVGASLRGVVVDAQAAVLRKAARQLEAKSAALSETSAGMIARDDCGADDIIRYGAYASGAASAAHMLRKQADELAGSCPKCADGKVFSDASRSFVPCEACS